MQNTDYTQGLLAWSFNAGNLSQLAAYRRGGMEVNPKTGRLLQALWVPSPNFDARPAHQTLDLLVIHGISLPPNQFDGSGVIDLFTNRINPNEDVYYKGLKDLRVSAHLFIRRGGEMIQFVNFNQRAWHAGMSSYKGRSNCNDFSVGIELEGADDRCYTAKQYQVLAQALNAIKRAYPSLKNAELVGHSDIAPMRKTDPGPLFNWRALKRLMAEPV